ncbi:MAG: MerR family transcriptional regulator [Micrococcales bacterium]
MSVNLANATAHRPSKLYTIGQVLNMLQPEFPELSSSKLRFLEEEGLVSPQRTASNYRKYTDYDINRIRVILDLQRSRYMPLEVIRQYLEDFEAGKKPNLPAGNTLQPAIIRLASKKLTKLELVAETGITDALIKEAQELKLLSDAPFDQVSVQIAHSLVGLKRFGLTPRHLRGLKASADREIGIIEGVIAPVLSSKDGSSRSKAAQYARDIEQQFAGIRNALIAAAISKIDN